MHFFKECTTCKKLRFIIKRAEFEFQSPVGKIKSKNEVCSKCAKNMGLMIKQSLPNENNQTK